MVARPLPVPLHVVLAASFIEAGHLVWEALHGGIAAHHLLARSDLPSFSNAWGIVLVPALALWASYRWRRRGATRAQVARGLLAGLAVGLAIACSFRLHAEAITQAVFFGAIAMCAVLPGYRAECLLGFVSGMSFTFGAVLPFLVGGVLALLSAALHLGPYRWLKRAWSRRPDS
jgi:hypothetical protein